jgi:hypothetical protein
MKNPREDVTYACTELQRRLKAKEVPDRQLVRFALLAIGQIALEEGMPSAKPLAAELLAAATAHEEKWTEALDSEISLAVAEHVGSVDPKFLDHPSYDFTYTIAARERLEARLRAMEAMNAIVDEKLLDQVSAADERLAPYLESRGSSGD